MLKIAWYVGGISIGSFSVSLSVFLSLGTGTPLVAYSGGNGHPELSVLNTTYSLASDGKLQSSRRDVTASLGRFGINATDGTGSLNVPVVKDGPATLGVSFTVGENTHIKQPFSDFDRGGLKTPGVYGYQQYPLGDVIPSPDTYPNRAGIQQALAWKRVHDASGLWGKSQTQYIPGIVPPVDMGFRGTSWTPVGTTGASNSSGSLGSLLKVAQLPQDTVTSLPEQNTYRANGLLNVRYWDNNEKAVASGFGSLTQHGRQLQPSKLTRTEHIPFPNLLNGQKRTGIDSLTISGLNDTGAVTVLAFAGLPRTDDLSVAGRKLIPSAQQIDFSNEDVQRILNNIAESNAARTRQ